MTSSRSVPCHRYFGVALAAIVVWALAVPSFAGAATTIGQLAPTSANVLQCVGATLFVQASEGGPPSYVVPDGGGVITSWSVLGSNVATGQLRLKLVNPTSGTDFTIAGQSEYRQITQSTLNTFPTRITVTGGEILALWVPDGTSDCLFSTATVGDTVRFRAGTHAEPGVGETFPTDAVAPGSKRLDVSAVLEPDADSDGFGDESQDQCPGTPGTDNGCIPSPPAPPAPAGEVDTSPPNTTITQQPKDKTNKRTATFAFSSSEPGSTFNCVLDDQQTFKPCTSPLTVKVKKGKHTFSVTATDLAGNADPSPATDGWKVKKKTKK